MNVVYEKLRKSLKLEFLAFLSLKGFVQVRIDAVFVFVWILNAEKSRQKFHCNPFGSKVKYITKRNYSVCEREKLAVIFRMFCVFSLFYTLKLSVDSCPFRVILKRGNL